jgi:phage tail-like protein
MTIVETPGLWLDNILLDQGAGVWVANQLPEPDETGVSVSANVVLEILSTDPGISIDLANTQVYLNAVLAYDGGAGGFQSGYDGPGSATAALGTTDQRITIDPTGAWTSEQLVTVRAVSQTVGATYTTDTSYSFTAADTVPPTLQAATAVSATTVRVVFDEGMDLGPSTDATSALNPSSYSVTLVPADDRQAGVATTVLSVAQGNDTAVAGDTVVLTLDIELSFWRTYSVSVDGPADEADNLLAGPQSVQFQSWTPPGWPADRSFLLWEMFSADCRNRDIHGDLERLLSTWQDVVDLLLWEQDRFPRIWDIDNAPEPNIDALLMDLGNPFRFDLTLIQKRRLASIIVAAYKQMGTKAAIINLARFFLQITVTVTAWADDTWVIGESELGVDTDLGPSGDNGWRELYTFTVESTTVLTEEQRRWLGQIVDEVKPHHTHYEIKDPSDVVVYDHWVLGISELGETSDLH